MSANCAENVKTYPKKLNVRKMYVWSYSTVVLHWFKNDEDYKIIFSNTVSKSKEKFYGMEICSYERNSSQSWE